MSAKTTNPNQTHEAVHKQQAVKPVAPQAAELTPATDLEALQQAVAAPGLARPADILALQRTVGNRAVTRLIQTKLTVGPAGDQYEQEADRVAAQVMRMPAVPRPVQRQPEEEEEELQTKPLAALITPVIRRQAAPEEEEEELQAKPLLQREGMPEEEEELQAKPLVQREAAPEEEELQTKPAVQRTSTGAGFDVGGEFEQQLAASRGGGSPLPADVRSFMEPRFGTDFSGVRLHTGSDATQLNREVSAQAFTHGQDIYLGEGKDDLASAQGKQLLAHELTHVVQQSGSQSPVVSRIQRLTELELLGGSKPTSRWGKVVGSVHAYNAATDKPVEERSGLLDAVEEALTASRALQTGSRGIRHRESRLQKREAGQNLLKEINTERTVLTTLTRYKVLVGLDLPGGLTGEEANDRLARYHRANGDCGASQWTLQLAHEIEDGGTPPNMDGVFDFFVARLRRNGFKYSSGGGAYFSETPASGNCRDFGMMLWALGTALGIPTEFAGVSAAFFATFSNQNLISTHMGNVKYEGQEYDTKRFVFFSHMAARSGGKYYDATFPDSKGFGSPAHEIAWELETPRGNRMEIKAVSDGAKFPDDTPVTPDSAYLEKDEGKTSEEFDEYWIVKKF